MSPPQVEPEKPQFTCDMMIYDEESDRHVRITWGEAVEACLIGNGNVDPDKAVVGAGTARDWKRKADEWTKYNAADPNAKAWGDADLDIDIRIVVARPFIEHLMHNAILTVSGRDTGATLFGPADMQLSANTQVKTIEGHYTGHFKAVVTKPQNVMVMRDIACAGYVAGGNCRWFAQKADGDMDAQTARDEIQSRLSFDDDITDRYASMLAFPAHEKQFTSGQLDTVMSVTSRLLPWEVNGANQVHASFPGGDAMFQEYRGVLGLDHIHYGEDLKAAENQDFISQGSTNNATCFVGPHRKYDPFTKSFMALIPGQGHFGPDAIPGVSSSHIQTIALFPYTFTTQLQLRFRCAEQRIGLTCTKHTRAFSDTPPVAGCALAPWRERVAQDGPRLDGRSRARAARADGVPGPLSACGHRPVKSMLLASSIRSISITTSSKPS